MIKRLLSVFHARNLEFIRDRSTMIFVLVLPIALIVGMSFVFGGKERPLFKVGVLTQAVDPQAHPFLSERFVDFVAVKDQKDAVHKVSRHALDLLVDVKSPVRYWVNPSSPKGYIVEKLLLQSDPAAHREPVSGDAVPYVNWLFPGILGMNLMFGCIFGVGYVVLRYRKNGFLKRLHATPLTAFEFLTAQVLSRLVLTVIVTTTLYLGISTLIHFHSVGSPLLLFMLLLLGSLSMIALGLTIASRFSSEELVGGLLNLLTWPMMLLSGVWFSLEGSPQWIQWVAQIFPLTHLLGAARAIMLDGAGVAAIATDLIYLAVTAVAFLAFGAWSFRWRVE
ncbi:MAG TPA: ABC transporter permease [Steroidobacteraceae bacterium]|jgi:ABC-type multidrug transport system permease subunit|nr:ABC transporter permease [Steroidobacteraceae bacterium]